MKENEQIRNEKLLNGDQPPGRMNVTYTLVFRVTREVWDAMEKGQKPLEYRDSTFFWDVRMRRANMACFAPVEALFLCGKRKVRYSVGHIWKIRRGQVPDQWRDYLIGPDVWAVELGERIA